MSRRSRVICMGMEIEAKVVCSKIESLESDPINTKMCSICYGKQMICFSSQEVLSEQCIPKGSSASNNPTVIRNMAKKEENIKRSKDPKSTIYTEEVLCAHRFAAQEMSRGVLLFCDRGNRKRLSDSRIPARSIQSNSSGGLFAGKAMIKERSAMRSRWASKRHRRALPFSWRLCREVCFWRFVRG